MAMVNAANLDGGGGWQDIRAEKDALNSLKEAITETIENYHSDVEKFTEIIDGMQNGTLEGDLFVDIQEKYSKKIDSLQTVGEVLNDAANGLDDSIAAFDLLGDYLTDLINQIP